MKAIVSLDEFRKNLSEIVARVMYSDETVFVQKHRRVGVVVISENEYESLKDPRKRFSSKADWDSYFVWLDKMRSRISKKDQARLPKIIAKEIRAVRAEKKQKA